MGATTAAVVACMLIAMLNSTFLLVAIFKYDCKVREKTFDTFWRNQCEEDWQLAFSAFTYGIPLFLVMLAQVGWVVFWTHDSRNLAASFVTTIAFVTLIFWLISTKYKWAEVLKTGHRKLNFRNSDTGFPPVDDVNHHQGRVDIHHVDSPPVVEDPNYLDNGSVASSDENATR
jgi:small-conductance mechanosensitive channel